MNFTVNQELIVRISVFTGVLLLMLIWEQLSPRRARTVITWRRRFNNLLLVAIDTLLVRLLLPLAAVSTAAIATIHNFGLFNSLGLNSWFAGCLSFLILDLIIYFQHRLFHKYSLLWRLHRVHHSDTEFDTTTGVRFHPLEIILSMCIKIAAVALLGPPIIAVIIFEIALNATAIFNHGNIKIPKKVEKKLRYFLVTPEMHRIHHSRIPRETDSNYSFSLSCWDRIFGTYQQQPKMGQQGVQFGIEGFNEPKEVNQIVGMLKLPFKGDVDHYAINRRSWQSGEDQNG